MSASQTQTDFYFRAASATAPEAQPREGSLASAVEAAMDNLDDTTLGARESHQGLSAFDAKRLLALLAWSYARELYSSAEIHSRLRRGRTAELWDHGIPEVEEICRFRSANRRALQSCLQMALQFLAAQKVAAGIVTKFDESHLAAEASRRIVASIFIDSMEATGRQMAVAC